jgi:Ca-activated chloride channel family protein
MLAILYYFRYKDRLQLWQTFQTKKNWPFAIRLSHPDHFFWRKIIVLSALFFIIIALLRPQYGKKYETVERQGRQLFFIVDTSLSMLAEDGAKTRLDLAKYHIQQLLPKINDDFMSIIPFASTAYTYLPLTTDRSAVDLFVDDMFVGMIGSSGSNIMNALSVVKSSIAANKMTNAATLIIFSDGEFTPPINPQVIDTLFKGMRIQSIVVGLGSLQGEPIPQRDENNRITQYKKDANGAIVLTKRMDEPLERLAEQLDGWTIEGSVSPMISEKIYQHLSQIETEQLEQNQVITAIDRYHVFLFIALVFLILDYLYPRLQLRYSKSLYLILFVLGSFYAHAAHPGVKSYQNENFDDAKQKFESSLLKSPDNGKLIYNLGNTYFKLNDTSNAIQAYTDAVDRLPEEKKINAYYNLGTAHLNNNNLEDALIAYKEVLSRAPNHVKTKQNLELILRKKAEASKNPQRSPDEAKSKNIPTDTTPPSGSKEPNNTSDPQENEINDDSKHSTPSEDTTDTPAGESTPTSPMQTEQQIQYLVDMAEKNAREKRQKANEQLFEGIAW